MEHIYQGMVAFCKCSIVLNHTRGEFMLYATGCPEEAGIIHVRTAFDEDVAEVLIVFIS